MARFSLFPIWLFKLPIFKLPGTLVQLSPKGLVGGGGGGVLFGSVLEQL